MAATTWDYFKTDDSDYGFYLDLIARGEGRVLDVVCATERLLIPYLKAGIDIEGVDSSEEMLSISFKMSVMLPILEIDRSSILSCFCSAAFACAVSCC